MPAAELACLWRARALEALRLYDLSKAALGQVRVELYDVRRTRFIQAHAAALACLTLSQDGRLLATASERGTLVRIHSTADGSRLQARVAQ